MTTNQPGIRPIRPVFVLILNGAVIVISSDGQQGGRAWVRLGGHTQQDQAGRADAQRDPPGRRQPMNAEIVAVTATNTKAD